MFKFLQIRFKEILLGLVVILMVTGFFSYRLLEVPTGLTVDEAAFGRNAVLLARTGYDQNGRFMPVFVNSIEGKDWRQPVTQYFIAGWFKVFGPSVWGLRFTSIVVTIVSGLLLYFLSFRLWRKGAVPVLVVLVFLMTPLLMIQSHMGLDNIYVIPFTLLWLVFLFLFSQTRLRKYLVLAGVSLGFGFYSYKGMRAVVPIWVLLTLGYLILSDWEGKLRSRVRIQDRILYSLIFGLSILPFFAIIPFLQMKYPGAVLGGSHPSIGSVYDFIYPYLSSFDFGFLFVKGDALLFHSTQKHGMMLLATLPLFLMGIYRMVKKGRGFEMFILLSFFSAPLLYGMVNSVHRASRLMVLIPLYALICGYGIEMMFSWKLKFYRVSFGLLLLVLVVINYGDFVNFYWFEYPKFTENIFGDLTVYEDYELMSFESKSRNLQPFVHVNYYAGVESENFFKQIYFSDAKDLREDIDLPVDGILMSQRADIPGLSRLDTVLPHYYLHVKGR